MNWNEVEGRWKQFKGDIQKNWGKLTEDEVDEAQGNRQKLEGLIQERYGKTQEQVKAEIDDWMKKK